jgi:hypothetical protein
MSTCTNLIDYLGGGFFFIAMLVIMIAIYTVAYYTGRQDGRGEMIRIHRAARQRSERSDY